MARFICPGCKTMFRVAPEDLGQVVACPKCGEPLATGPAQAGPPAPGGQASPPPPPAPSLPPGGWTGYAPGGQGLAAAKRFSPVGLASFLLGLAAWVAYFAIANIILAPVTQDGGHLGMAEAQEQVRRALADAPHWARPALVATAAAALVGLILGIGSLASPNRRRGFAIAGVIVCALGVLCIGLLSLSMGAIARGG